VKSLRVLPAVLPALMLAAACSDGSVAPDAESEVEPVADCTVERVDVLLHGYSSIEFGGSIPVVARVIAERGHGRLDSISARFGDVTSVPNPVAPIDARSSQGNSSGCDTTTTEARYVAPWGEVIDTVCAWAGAVSNCTTAHSVPSAIGYVAYSGSNEGTWIARADGSVARQVPALSRSGYLYQPSWSAKRNALAVEDPGIISVVDLLAGDAVDTFRVGTRLNWQPSWSPDGSRIAFYYWDSQRDGIAVLDLQSSAVTRVTDDSLVCPSCWQPESCPSWSPDGSRIVYHRAYSGVWIVSVDGTSKQLVRATTSEPNGCPSWLADGRIVFADSGSLWSMSADGSGLTYLSPDPGYQPRLDSVGTRVCFLRSNPTPPGVSGGGTTLYLSDLTTHQEFPLGSDGSRIWSCGWRR